MGLVVDEVVIESQGASYESSKNELKSEGRPTVTVLVSEASVSSFLDKNSPDNLRGVSVTIADGFVSVKATIKILVEVKVVAACTLRLVDGKQLWADLDNLNIKAPLAINLVEQQLAKINPLVDLNELSVPATITSVRAEGGAIELLGALDDSSWTFGS